MTAAHLFNFVAVSLVGIGLWQILYRRNLLAVLCGVSTALLGTSFLGVLIGGQAIYLSFVTLILIGVMLVVGLSLLYRRFQQTGTPNLDEKNELRN